MSSMKETKALKSWSKQNLPDDLWLEILCRLPAKSLVRFRCVSKSWQSMVNDPNFCRQHLNKFNNNFYETHCFVSQYEGSKKYKENYIIRSSDTFKCTARLTSLDIAGLGKEWFVACSMDGLFMLRYYAPTRDLMLWNPSIKRVRALPPSPVVISEGMNIVDLGFGFSSFVNDYKIVRLLQQGKRNLHSIAIYTVGTSLWKTVKFHGKGISNWCWHFEYSMWRTVCFRGCLYFIATNLNTEDEELVSFDLSNEVFASAVAPIAYETIGVDFILKGVTLVLGGYLLGLVYLLPEEGCIWVSESNADGFDFTKWTKLFIFVNFAPQFDRFNYARDAPKFLYLGKNGDVLLQWDSKWVTACSLETEEERTLLKNRRLDMAMVCGYIESLVLLNG